jgi:hypothetical protein
MNILSENQQQLRVRSTWGRNYLKTFLLFRHDNRHPTFLFLSLSVCVRGSQWKKNSTRFNTVPPWSSLTTPPEPTQVVVNQNKTDSYQFFHQFTSRFKPNQL